MLTVDKTGTLTENRIRVVLIETAAGTCDLRRSNVLDAAATELLETALAGAMLAIAVGAAAVVAGGKLLRRGRRIP